MGAASDAWVAAGLAALTGRTDGPALVPGEATVAVVGDLVRGAPVDEPLRLLGERAALAGWSRQGATSCGGGTRLLAAADGWLAVNLARDEDRAALPAWLGLPTDPPDPWAAVADVAAARPAAELVAAAGPLGLAVARLGEVPPGPPAIGAHRRGEAEPLVGPPLVVDLSSLWAGPLCAHLLQLDGARVVKVEAAGRPDGGRADTTGFFDLLHHGQESVALDLPSTYGLAQLRRLLAVADVVIEGSRPRALRQWGINAEALLAADQGPRVWVSITGHGREGDAGVRVAFGDDAAVAGGLVGWDGDGPVFAADAIADPLTGITAHRAVTEALAGGGRWLLDLALARVAASVAGAVGAAGNARDAGPSLAMADAPPPTARPVPGPAPDLGADTETVLAGLPPRR